MAKKFLVLCAAIGVSLIFGCVSPAPFFKDPIIGMEMVYVKGGCYQMGDTSGEGGAEEKPVHEVCVRDFYMGKYEVTQGQWISIMENNPSTFKDPGGIRPVETVNWNDAQDFINRLNSRNGGSKYRLPTEAEWEYAARSGGKSEKYAGGNDIDKVAWYAISPDNSTKPVGRKAPNGLAIYDMSGNVWEWTNDWYGSSYYASSPRNNPIGPTSGDRRVVRGGSWFNEIFDVRVSYRNYLAPDYRSSDIGFRLLRTP